MRTDEQRRKMAGRIAAEFVALTLAAEEIERSGGRRYVPLDAFLLHARKLRDFFRPRDPYPEGVAVASDYVHDVEEWHRHRDRLTSDWLERTRPAVREKLAGFRWALEGQRLRWKEWLDAVPHLYAELKSHWDIFLWATAPEVRAWFIRGYERQMDVQRDWPSPDHTD